MSEIKAGDPCFLIKVILTPGAMEADHVTRTVYPSAEFYAIGNEEYVGWGWNKNEAINTIIEKLESLKDKDL